MSTSGTAYALGTFSIAGSVPFAGLLLDGRVIAVRALNCLAAELGGRITGADTVLGITQAWDENVLTLRRAAQALRAGPLAARLHSTAVSVDALRVHAPIEPRQIICAGGNYRKHVIQMVTAYGTMSVEDAQRMIDKIAAEGEPYAWSKLPSAITGPYDAIMLPPTTAKADWELELAVIMGRPARHVKRQDALDCVAGYCVANDLTSRDLIFRTDLKDVGTDWLRSKCTPGFLPLGPYLVPAEFVGNPHDLRIVLKHNGKIMQDENTSDMIHGVARLIEYISRHVQLYPGDVICTGSPAGNGMHHGVFLQPGDVLEGSITGLGTLTNRILSADASASLELQV